MSIVGAPLALPAARIEVDGQPFNTGNVNLRLVAGGPLIRPAAEDLQIATPPYNPGVFSQASNLPALYSAHMLNGLTSSGIRVFADEEWGKPGFPVKMPCTVIVFGLDLHSDFLTTTLGDPAYPTFALPYSGIILTDTATLLAGAIALCQSMGITLAAGRCGPFYGLDRYYPFDQPGSTFPLSAGVDGLFGTRGLGGAGSVQSALTNSLLYRGGKCLVINFESVIYAHAHALSDGDTNDPLMDFDAGYLAEGRDQFADMVDRFEKFELHCAYEPIALTAGQDNYMQKLEGQVPQADYVTAITDSLPITFHSLDFTGGIDTFVSDLITDFFS